MERFIRYNTCLFLLLWASISSCSNEMEFASNGNLQQRVSMNFRMLPRQGNAEFGEKQIDDVYIFVFVDNLLTDIQQNTTTQDNKLGFEINATKHHTEIHFLANSGLTINQLNYLKGTHVKDFKHALPDLTPLPKYDRLPMWGHLEFSNGIEATEEGQKLPYSVQLLRTVAKVVINQAEHIGDDIFKLNSVRIYRANKGVIIPDITAMHTSEYRVNRPTLPVQNDLEPANEVVGVNQPSFPLVLYLNESDGMDANNLDWSNKLSTIIVGGFYKESQEETFYRLDSRHGNSEDLVIVGELLRNHFYTFLINKVSGPGCESPTTASNFIDCGTALEVVGWIPTEWDFASLGETFYGAYTVTDWVLAQSSLLLGILGSQTHPWIPKDLIDEFGNSGSQTIPWVPKEEDPNFGNGESPTIPWIPKEEEGDIGNKENPIKPWVPGTNNESIGKPTVNMVIPWHRFNWAGFYGKGKYDIVEPWKHLTKIIFDNMGQDVEDFSQKELNN